MLYPVNMNQHGPCRSLEQRLDELVAELGRTPMQDPRAAELARQIRAVEAEIDARSAP